jgi:hypothetical protein
MKKKRIPQSIIPTDDDRAAFKKKCKAALKSIEDEYGISFEFGRIDERYSGQARMRVWFKKTKEVDDSNLWDSPAAIALTDAMRKDRIRSDIRLFRKIDHVNFTPRVIATYKGEELFNLSIEIWQDIKYGDWSGMFNRDRKPDPIQSNEYVENEITLMCIHEKPHFREQIIEAFAMMRESKGNQPA